MHREILSLAWLGTRLLFLHVRGGQTVASWECEGSIGEYERGELKFGPILRQAVKNTGYRGKNVVMLLDHARMTLQLLSTPPAKGRDLELYVERQLGQLKVHDEDVAWSWLPTQPIKSSKGLVLCLCPQESVQRLYEDCQREELHLLMILPPAAALAAEFNSLPVEETDITLLAVDTGEGNTLLIGRRGEPIFMARALRCSWQENPDRVASQINRSTVFLRQQFGTDISRIWLTGAAAREIAGLIQEEAGMPVDSSPAYPQTFWAEKAASISPESEANLVHRDLRLGPRRRQMKVLAACGIAFLAVFSLASFGWVELRIRSAKELVAGKREGETRATESKADLEARLQEIDAKEKVAEFVGSGLLPPIPGWLTVHLARTMPPQLLLTGIQVRRRDAYSGQTEKVEEPDWWVRIEGYAPEKAVAEEGPEPVKAAFEQFSKELAEGPFRLQIAEKTNRFVPRAAPIAWSVIGGAPSTSSPNRFFIEGTIRQNKAE